MTDLNKKQNKILKIGLAAILLCCLFPPWTSTYKVKALHVMRSEGYSFIAFPPEKYSIRYNIKLDVTRLLLQLFIVSVATGGGIILNKEKKK